MSISEKDTTTATWLKMLGTEITEKRWVRLEKKHGAEGVGTMLKLTLLILNATSKKIENNIDDLEDLYDFDSQVVDFVINESGYFVVIDEYIYSIFVNETLDKVKAKSLKMSDL